MRLLDRFGSRNHPEAPARRRARLAQLESMPVTEETVARYTAARAFLLAEWFGASLVVASFTLLYVFAAVPGGPSVPVTLAVCLGLLAVGGFVFLRSHRYYVRMQFPWAKRWDTAALVVAGSGAIFWLLFALLEVLTLLGVPVLPESRTLAK